MNVTEVSNDIPSTFETITDLFAGIDIITLPIFLVVYVIMNIYNIVRDNKNFKKTYEQKREKMDNSNFYNSAFNQNSVDLIKTISNNLGMVALQPKAESRNNSVHNNSGTASALTPAL